MESRQLGNLTVSVVGLGGNNFGRPSVRGGPTVGTAEGDLDRTIAVVRAALDAGVTVIDTAEEYALGESEEFIGKALGKRRDRAVIATKFNSAISPTSGQGAGADRVVRSAEASLNRLGTDRIDLFQIHQPDPSTPIEETLGALNALIQQGKVREIGCCNFSAGQIDEAAQVAAREHLQGFASVQTSYSLLSRKRAEGLMAVVERHGMRLIPYWPLAGGILTGKYRRGMAPPAGARLATRNAEDLAHLLRDSVLDKVDALQEIAAARGVSLADLSISWLLAQPTVACVLTGATNASQVLANAAASTVELTPADLEDIDRITLGP